MVLNFNAACGVLISLIWEACSINVIIFYFSSRSLPSFWYFIAVASAVVIGSALLPMFGWLGDTVLGRYRTVKYSILLLWLLILINGSAEVIFEILEIDNWINSAISKTIPFFVFPVSLCAFVNIIHFGIDQIADSPSWKIGSYISWFTWCFFLCYVFKSMAFECFSNLISTGFAAFLLTVSICTDALQGKQNLFIPPTSPNSLKVIFLVLKYALRNRYPSVSYWDTNNSRIDTAKRKYGGPFMNEEVEDVKAFLKVLTIIVVGGFLPGVFITFTTFSGSVLMYHYKDSHYIQPNINHPRHCLVRSFVYNAASYFIVIGVPIYECAFYRCLWKYVASVSISKRFIAGICFLFLTQLNYLSFELAGHFLVGHHNSTIPCLLTASEATVMLNETIELSFYWLILPEMFGAIAYYLLLTSAMELLCSQSPYSMKGLIMGCSWSVLSLSVLSGIGVSQIFSSIGNTAYVPCGISYFLFSSVATFLLVVVVSLVLFWYSKRRRRDNTEEECMSVSSRSDYI